jgi:DNA-binding NtrC family response regulator
MKKVLIVDDEKDIGTLMVMILKSVGMEVEYASGPVQAASYLEQNQFNTIFLDLNLGGSYGLDLMPLIRQSQENAEVIVISAHSEPSTLEKVQEAGISNFIQKPFKRMEIIEAVKKAS